MKQIFHNSLVAIFTLTTIGTNAQIITTIAGNGVYGYSGDGGPATAAEFWFPYRVAVDGAGNIYVADRENNVIRKINASGIITTVAGSTTGAWGYSGDGGPATDAELDVPSDVAIDSSGNLFIADLNNNVIRKVNTSGIITTVVGNGSGAGTGYGSYGGDGGPATNAGLWSPKGVAVDNAGNIFIADFNNNVIRKVDASGFITTVSGSTQGYSGDGGPATMAQLFWPAAVAADNSGNFFITDQHNNRIRKVNTYGIITTVAGNGAAAYGGDGSAATAARLIPSGITVDSLGNLFIADAANQRIRKVNVSGTITTVAGNGYVSGGGLGGYSGDGGHATAAELNIPSGIAIDGSGNLFIADQGNNVIRKVIANSVLATQQITDANNNICLLPNPNKGIFTIKGSLNSARDENAFVEITDMLGQVVYKTEIIVQKGTINKQLKLQNNLPDGMYILKIMSETEAGIYRFVIEK